MKNETTSAIISLLLFVSSAFANNPPVAIVTFTNEVRVPPIIDEPNHYVLIAPNAVTASTALDASRSYDPDGDPLHFTWYNGEFFAFVPILPWSPPAGTDIDLVLYVSDLAADSEVRFRLTVITPAQTVQLIIDALEEDDGGRHPKKAKKEALSLLRDALARFNTQDFNGALATLREFQVRFRHTPIAQDRAITAAMRRLTDILIETVSGKP